MNLSIKLEQNGMFTILVNETPLISDCFPAVDGRPIRVVQTQLNNDEIHYQCLEGTLVLKLHPLSDTSWVISSKFGQWTSLIHHFSVFNGAMEAFQGCFQSSGQIGGECGYHSYQQLDGRPRLISRGMIAFAVDQAALVAYVCDHTRWHQEFCLDHLPDGIQVMSADYRLERAHETDFCLPDLYLSVFPTLDEALNTGAMRIGEAMHARTHQPPAYHWCSWYYNYSEFDQEQLTEYLEGFRTVPLSSKLRYFQIDAGYSKALGDWLIPRGRWTKGLESAIQEVEQAGYLPGLWIGPFMVGNRSELYKNHPDWVLCDLNGKPLVGMCTDNEPKLWGYHDEEYYILDTSHPDAMTYLRTVFREMTRWGVQLFKTDFMLWGYQDSTKVRRYTPGKTSVEYFRDVLQMIREEIGEDRYWLGCIAPFFPFIGYADGMRIGGDVGSSWDGEFNPHSMIDAVKGNYFTNYRYYQNDPDAIFFRDFHIRLKDSEIEALALYAALSGGCVYTSDPIHQLREDRLKLLEFLEPSEKHLVPKLPYMQDEREELVLVHQAEHGRGLVFVFNPTEKPIFTQYSWESLGFSEDAWYIERRQPAKPAGKDLLLYTPPHDYHLLVVGPNSSVTFDETNLWKNLTENGES